MTPADLRDLVATLEAQVKERETALFEAEARLHPAKAALASLDKTGYCVYGGEAMWETPPVKTPAPEYIPFDNEVPQKLAKRAIDGGLRNFFDRPLGGQK